MPSAIFAASIVAAVVSVHDGDTLRVMMRDRQQISVRVAGVDSPEIKSVTLAGCVPAQPWSCEARQAVIMLCLGRNATITMRGRDRYGRTLAQVRCGSRDLGEMLVRGGLAWAWPGRPRLAALPELEADARRDRRGLWSGAAPVAPWAWRGSRRR